MIVRDMMMMNMVIVMIVKDNDGEYGVVRDIMVMIVMVVIISFVYLLVFSQVRFLLRETLPWEPQFWDRASSPSEKKTFTCS